MSRSGDPLELLIGPMQFVLVMTWLGLFRFMTLDATVIMAALGIGDGIAPLVGKKWGKHTYDVLGGTPKTIEGSIGGVFCGTILGCYIYPPLLGFGFLPLRLVVTLAAVATVGEGSAPFYSDNIVVPLMIHLTMGQFVEAFG